MRFAQCELDEQIEHLRGRLSELVAGEQDLLKPEVLGISLRLDRLIVDYLREHHAYSRASAAD